MRTLLALALAALLAASVACSGTTPAEPAAAADVRPTGTIKEIMDSVIDPSADVLWESVSTTINREGQTDKMPRTEDEWQAVRRSAVTLVEATNLLVIGHRQVAPSGHKSEYPGIELEPEQIQKTVDADRAAWVRYAHGLHDAAMVALKAIDSKSVQGLMDAGENIDEACENCHKHYWYPDQKVS
jgi:cytochrome c556